MVGTCEVYHARKVIGRRYLCYAGLMLFLWKISQYHNNDYDTYDSAIVIAETAHDARHIHPRRVASECSCDFYPLHDGGDWALPEHVTAECVGQSAPGLVAGTVLVASYNAG